MEWAIMPLKKYADFTGRARRKEYWMFVLLVIVCDIVATIIDRILGMSTMVAGVYGPVMCLVALALFIPGLAVSVRRLHDTGRVGWWVLLPIVPEIAAVALLYSGNLPMAGILGIVTLVAAIALLIFMVLPGTKGPNQYGPDPVT